MEEDWGTIPGFIQLAKPRDIGKVEWPQELVNFYMRYQGVGLSYQEEYVVRLARPEEVVLKTASHFFAEDALPHEGWKRFSGWLVGYSETGDAIMCVVDAPGMDAGAILAIGPGAMTGPPGDDREGPEGALVLARGMGEWIARMERLGADAHGLYVLIDLAEEVQEKIVREIASLNPHSKWAKQ